MKTMHNPPHPGKLVKDSLSELNVTITQAAKDMSISRKHLSNIINCKVPVTADIAVRLAAYVGSTARLWLGIQAKYDLWQLKDVDYGIKRSA